MTPSLLLVAHGSRDPAAHTCVVHLAAAVGAELPGVPVHVGFVDVRAPGLACAVAGLDAAVVVPAFLASGYHVRTDLPAQLTACGRRAARFTITPALGPDPLLVRAALDRLADAGWRPGDAVVLAAAGSSDPNALADVRAAAGLLAAAAGRSVRVGYAAAVPRVEELVAGLRRAGAARVAVASWLLAPGFYQRRLAACGADLVTAPLGTHPAVVAAVVDRYRAAVEARVAA